MGECTFLIIRVPLFFFFLPPPLHTFTHKLILRLKRLFCRYGSLPKEWIEPLVNARWLEGKLRLLLSLLGL